MVSDTKEGANGRTQREMVVSDTKEAVNGRTQRETVVSAAKDGITGLTHGEKRDDNDSCSELQCLKSLSEIRNKANGYITR